jgi:exopolyphosphatase/guanosine-5'-triphosphate,3'-diphosphate pyrophosphatase
MVATGGATGRVLSRPRRRDGLRRLRVMQLPASSSTSQRELRGSDVAAVRDQLGREPTTPFVVVARCTGGHPLVIRNAPLDARGDPFPTTYWLTCPAAVKAVSRLESEGSIARLNERMREEGGFGERVVAAHASYAADRARDLESSRAWGGVAGTRVGIKCLHAHYAYHLAGGDDPVGAWVAPRVEPIHPEQRSDRVAAIDQGTNSIRLLVAEPSPAGDGAVTIPTELARDMVITRLGQGVDRTGRIDPAALARTVEVLETFCRRARALGAERIRVGATSAVRDAANRDGFADAVRRLAGSELEIITGEDEAGLSFLGGTFGLEPAGGPFLVQDIGGGSTEFVVGARPGIADHAISTQMGSVRLTERHVRHDPPAPGDLDALRRDVVSLLVETEGAVPVGAARTFVAVAGTATTMQALSLGLDRYDPDAIHRSWLTADDAERVLEDLIAMTGPERAALPVMVPGRGDVIVAGAVILVETMRRFGFARALVSETDILDGLAYEMLGIR